jgi:molecular chaperone GrpE (heat shock protein)
MRNLSVPRLSKWPFLLSDVLLLGLAFLIYTQSRRPMISWELFACALCVLVGASCGAFPFVLEYRVLTRLLVANRIAHASEEIRKLECFAGQVADATARWQTVQESADKTAQGAREIAERIAAEVKGFNAFLRSASEGEKSALRLEVEKLRRAEHEFLQVLVRMLDHVYALHQAALRSGQPALIEQLGQFQNACRDAARRVGFAPFAAAPAEPFDQQRHQLVDGHAPPPPDATVEETVATGYTFQGRLLRPALVRVSNGNGSAPQSPAAAPGPDPAQSQLPLDPTRTSGPPVA